MLKGANAPKSTLAFVLIVAAAVIYIVFWFTGRKPERKDISIAGSLYIADRIDTLTALPAFERLIREKKPRLIILDESVVFSLNLVRSLYTDSVPEWRGAVEEQFREKLRELEQELRFEVKYVRPWRLDVIEARKKYLASVGNTDEFIGRRSGYELVHEAAERCFPSDTLFNYPLLINSAAFAFTRDVERLVFENLFDGELLAGSYTEYNRRILDQIEKILGGSIARRVLIFCHPLYRLWYEKNLKALLPSPDSDTSHEL